MRSKLFVPGTRPELFAKALAGEADALSFDLEDSVAPERKAEARALVAEFVRRPETRASGKLVIVRTNARDTGYFTEDVQAVCCDGVGLLNIPKVESPDDVLAVAALLDRIESSDGSTMPLGLLVNIETPKGLRQVAAIATAHPRVRGLQLGLGDLFEPQGIDRQDPANLHAAMFALRMAAAEAGVFAIDAVFTGIRDAEGFEREAMMARRLGFLGKSCIHPSQVAIANRVFSPSDDELAHAHRVVDEARVAAAAGRGAFVVDGRMIDPPFLKRAEAIVASAPPRRDRSS